MATPVELAVDTYVKVWGERDPVRLAAMIEACFAPGGRIVTRGQDIVGHAGFADMIARVQADPQFLRVRLTSAIDAVRTTFRFRAVVDRRDGTTSVESNDAGEIDATGRISVLLTFTGPLGEAPTEIAEAG